MKLNRGTASHPAVVLLQVTAPTGLKWAYTEKQKLSDQSSTTIRQCVYLPPSANSKVRLLFYSGHRLFIGSESSWAEPRESSNAFTLQKKQKKTKVGYDCVFIGSPCKFMVQVTPETYIFISPVFPQPLNLPFSPLLSAFPPSLSLRRHQTLNEL